MSRQFYHPSFSRSLRLCRASRRYSYPFRLACLSCVLLLLASCGKKEAASQEPKSAGPRVKWQFRSAHYALSHPALSPDGTIYIGTSHGLQAISPDGKLQWETALNTPGTPVVSEDGTIYVALRPGLIFGVSKEGQRVWQPGYGLIGFAAPPALGPDTTLYFMNSVADIYTFQPKRSGQKIWSLDTFREGMLGASTILPGSARVGVISTNAAPLITRAGSIILPRQNFLDSISAGGSPEWDLELTSGSLGQAALSNDGIIYVGDNQSVLFAVDSSGSKKWRFDSTGSVIGSPVIDIEGVIYFTAGDAVYALNPDGTLKWRFSSPSATHLLTSPALAADGTLYLGGEFTLFALHPDGTLKWNLHLYSPTSSPAIGPDGTIYFACGYSWLCAVEDSGSPLMPSAWAKQFHDLANTSNPLHDGN